MRCALALASLVVASSTRAATIETSLPPAPENYLPISLAWADGEPVSVLGFSPLPSGEQKVQLDGLEEFWYLRSINDLPSQYAGMMQLQWGPGGQLGTTRFSLLDFGPELDAALPAIDVALGLREGPDHWNYTRSMTVTATGGYERVTSIRDVPEPAAWSLFVVAAVGLAARYRRP